MHFEVMVEDSSGEKLLHALLPKILGPEGKQHSWRVHAYKGIGHIPKGLRAHTDASTRVLLDRLPAVLQGYGKTPGVDAVVVVLDADKRDCAAFLAELRDIAARCHPAPETVLFRLAIEEVEAWYFGDRVALTTAFPRANDQILDRYVQDSRCNTWELLADAIHPGGCTAVKKAGWPLPGQLKHDWAERIGPHLDPDRNASPSFQRLRDGLRRLAS